MLTCETHTVDETVRCGEEFSRALRPGDVVALFGGLGTGKTHFVKGVCKGLGVEEHVASPTFTILNEYHVANIVIYHFDFYRIRSGVEVREIGFEECVSSPRAISLIEWADRVREFLPERRYNVQLGLGAGSDTRHIAIADVPEGVA